MFICGYIYIALGGKTYQMKIIFVVDTYYPRQDGVQAVTQYLAEGLAQRRHEVLILTSWREGLQRREVYNAVAIERYYVKKNPFTLHFVGERKQISRRMKAFQPEAIIFVSIGIWCYDWFKHHLNQYPGKKILYTHGFTIRNDYSVWEKIRAIRICRQIVPLLMNIYMEAYHKHYQKRLLTDMAKFDRTVYLYEKDDLYLFMRQNDVQNEIIIENAVEDSFFERKAFLESYVEELIFINISSYNENKNQKLLLKAFYEAKIPSSRLILIGSTETTYYREILMLNDELRKKNPNLDINVEILCGLPRKEIIEIYTKVHVYLSSSCHEAMSIAVCEAAAAGLAIISTPVGHVPSIPGVQLCDGLTEFCNMLRIISFDGKLRRTCGQLAYEYAEKHYRIQMKVNQMESIILWEGEYGKYSIAVQEKEDETGY